MNISDLAEVLETVKQLTKEAGDVILTSMRRIFLLTKAKTNRQLPWLTKSRMILIVHTLKAGTLNALFWQKSPGIIWTG